MGWRIVQSYMESNPEVSLRQMLELPGVELFRESDYKPPK